MLYLPGILALFEVLIYILPVLLAVAFVTVAERRTMASMQRRLGPNVVGYYGLLQAFADALKLLLKEYVSPTQANIILFFLGPIITLVFSLLGYAAIPLAPGLSIFDFNISLLFILAVSSLATYGILLAGWSANSKYAFLGSLRSTAQLISYELVLSSGVLIIVLITSSLNLTVNVEIQKCVWLFIPLFPIFIVFLIAGIAETNRAPFDLAEAESELVSGFMTEHSAVIFVFFFLAEYASIILICILITVLFLGGYNINIETTSNIIDVIYLITCYSLFIITLLTNELINLLATIVETTYSIIYSFDYNLGISGLIDFLNVNLLKVCDNELSRVSFPDVSSTYCDYNVNGVNNLNYSHFLSERSFNDFDIGVLLSNATTENTIYGLIIAVKSFVMVFIFIWVRASLPRIRYDQLMVYCWTIMLPVAFGFIVLIPCIIYLLKISPTNVLFF